MNEARELTLLKRQPGIGAQQIKKQRARNHKSRSPTQEITSHEIHEISDDLGGDDKDSQTPPPNSVLEPTRGYHEGNAQQKKERAQEVPSWSKRLVSGLIQSPTCRGPYPAKLAGACAHDVWNRAGSSRMIVGVRRCFATTP